MKTEREYIEAAQPGAAPWENEMAYFPQCATGEQLQRFAEDEEDRMSARERAIEDQAEQIIENRKTMEGILSDACESDSDITEKLIAAIAEMSHEYYKRQTEEERVLGIRDAFISLTAMLEQLAEKAAIEAVDNPGRTYVY